jgi:hypothetical protein
MAENFKPQPYYFKYSVEDSELTIDINLSNRTVIVVDEHGEHLLQVDVNRLKLIIEHMELKCNEYEHG